LTTMAVREKTKFIPNEIYFITFTVLGWKHVFTRDKYCYLIYKWFDYIKTNYFNKIYGYVIMPNHIHVIIKITEKSTQLPILIFNAKRFLAYQIVNLLTTDKNNHLLSFFRANKTKIKAKHKVFAPHYDSLLILSPEFFLEKLNYIHNNPCREKWQLADEPEHFKHSSAANYILGQGVYDIDIMDF